MRTLLALAVLLSACEASETVRSSDTAIAQPDTATGAAGPMTVIGQLTWQTASAPVAYQWKEAEAYCEDLALGPFSDWRLPTIDELKGTIDTTAPSCPFVVDPLKATTECGWYWSASRFQNSSPWGVSFYDGSSSFSGIPSHSRVRCVR